MLHHWKITSPQVTPEHLGLIPAFFSLDDPRPAREQIDENYAHGGGWHPLPNFAMTPDALHYPGDPPFVMLAEAKLRDETIRIYRAAFVAIVQPDGSFEVGRVD